MRRIFETLVLGVTAAGIIVVFRLFGGFTLSASILLGVCFAIMGEWIHGLYTIAGFKPYSLQFFINFEALREDLGMVKDAVPDGDETVPYELHNFTAISPSLLIYFREYVGQTADELGLTGKNTRTDDEYRSAIQFGDTIPGKLQFSTEWGNPNTSIFWLPRVIFTHGWTGFELKLQVVPEWWSEYKKHLSSELRDLPVSYDGFIVLAHLPYGYIPDHVRKFYEPVSVFYPFDRIHRRWKTKLSKHGWTVTEADHEISSRYLIVRYSGIWPAT
jgi:hypothetical protein